MQYDAVVIAATGGKTPQTLQIAKVLLRLNEVCVRSGGMSNAFGNLDVTLACKNHSMETDDRGIRVVLIFLRGAESAETHH